MIPYILVGALALSVASGIAGYVKGREDGAEKWIPMVAELESQLHTLQTEGDARAKRAETAAAKATAELARVRKQAEADRAKADGIRAEWAAYVGGLRPAPVAGAGKCEADLAAARADAAAYSSALDRVLASAINIREIAVLNTEQLRQIQEWLREASK